MRPICRSSLVLAVALIFLTTGLEITAAAGSSAEPRTQRSARRKTPAKKPSRTVGKARSRNRNRVTTQARRGRNARNRRRRSSTVASDSSSGVRQLGSGIPAERVTEIQSALIKLGYLEGPPSGQYSDATVAAMKQFQADNRLSATGLPSAHSLKRLGVSKRSADGYAAPVTKLSRSDKGQGPTSTQP